MGTGAGILLQGGAHTLLPAAAVAHTPLTHRLEGRRVQDMSAVQEHSGGAEHFTLGHDLLTHTHTHTTHTHTHTHDKTHTHTHTHTHIYSHTDTHTHTHTHSTHTQSRHR